jgi:hypothetical protein
VGVGTYVERRRLEEWMDGREVEEGRKDGWVKGWMGGDAEMDEEESEREREKGQSASINSGGRMLPPSSPPKRVYKHV